MSVFASINVKAVAVRVVGSILPTAGRVLAYLLQTTRPELAKALRRVPETTQQLGPVPNIQGQNLTSALVKAARLGVDNPEDLRRHLQALPIERWPEAVVNFGQATFLRQTTEALLRACRTIGFDRVKVQDDRRGGVRVIAEDRGGRALVTEVGSDGCLRSEVLGMSDPSCQHVMEAFLQALRKEGLEFRTEASLRWTGGVPQTATGREWVRRLAPTRVTPEVVSQGTPSRKPIQKKKILIGG